MEETTPDVAQPGLGLPASGGQSGAAITVRCMFWAHPAWCKGFNTLKDFPGPEERSLADIPLPPSCRAAVGIEHHRHGQGLPCIRLIPGHSFVKHSVENGKGTANTTADLEILPGWE